LYPATAKDSETGFLHLCFEGNDLQSVHDYYVARGLKPGDVHKAGAGNLLFTMPGPLSPTGPQNMEYTQYMPGSLHSKDVGQHLGADRIMDRLVSVTLAMDDPASTTAFYLDKAGFTQKKIDGRALLVLPGTVDQTLAIVPSGELGHKARITFHANLAQAAAELKKRGIAFSKGKSDLLMTDPDGNILVLR
jgi:hypothetical protein